jgi:hypothetical protein
VDHYSRHHYIGSRMPMRMLGESIEDMKNMHKRFPDLSDSLELSSTEWNCDSMGGPPAQAPWNASLMVKFVRIMLDGGFGHAYVFCVTDYPFHRKGTPVFGKWLGIITANGVPKPAYNAFLFLGELKGGRRVPLVSSNDPIDGLAVLLPDNTVRMVLTNFDEDVSRQPYNTEVTVNITGLSNGDYRCTRLLACDDRHGNSYGKWLELGKPVIGDDQARDRMIEASRPVSLALPPVQHVDGKLGVKLTIPSPGIRLLEVRPDS